MKVLFYQTIIYLYWDLFKHNLLSELYSWQSGHDGHYHGGQAASFASASAGSIGGSGYDGGHSGANAQSGSFTIGPISASFSSAQASSENNGFFYR